MRLEGLMQRITTPSSLRSHEPLSHVEAASTKRKRGDEEEASGADMREEETDSGIEWIESDEEADEEDTGGVAPRDEIPTRRKPSRATSRRRLATLELPGDEELMQAVMAFEAKFADPAQPTQPLWNAVARACGDRFQRNGSRATGRVRWLTKVWLDRSHRLHQRMSADLKGLLKRYAQTRERRHRHQAGSSDNASGSTSLCEKDTAAQEGGALGDFERLPWYRRVHRKAPRIDSALEENVAQIVLKHAPRFRNASSKLLVWEAIVRDSRGRYESVMSAQKRTLWLCEVAGSPTHPRYLDLTPTLRSLLRQIHSYWRDDVATQPSLPIVDRLRTSNRNVETEKDELLMRLVLKLRPFTLSGENKSAVWTEIVQSAKHPLVRDAANGKNRVQFLIHAFHNSSHDQHTKLTSSLREMLTKYKKIVALFRSTQRESVRSHEFSRLGVRAPERNVDPEQCKPQSTSPVQVSRPQSDQHPRQVTASPRPYTSRPSVVAAAKSPPKRTEQDPAIASLALQVAKLEQEQRELRGDLRDQSEAHHRDMTAMLQLLEKERQDRKEEFTAMLGLVTRTRFGAPQEPPAAATAYAGGNSRTNCVDDCLL